MFPLQNLARKDLKRTGDCGQSLAASTVCEHEKSKNATKPGEISTD